MENIYTAFKHRDNLLSAILQCDGMALQYFCGLIEEYSLYVNDAVANAKESPNGLTFDSLVLYLLCQTFEKVFIDLRADFDSDNEYDLDELKFRDRYTKFHLNKMDSKITIKKKIAIEDGWPKEFVEQLSEKIVDI